MAITTNYDDKNYLVSVKSILQEFLSSYFDGGNHLSVDFPTCDINISKIQIDPPLSVPIISIIHIGGFLKNFAGKGISYDNVLNKIKKGVKDILNFTIEIITTQETGGVLKRDTISGRLLALFEIKQDELGKKNVKKTEITQAVDKSDSTFFKNIHFLSLESYRTFEEDL